MHNYKINLRVFVQKIWCSLFGHHYVTTRNITNYFKEYECTVCHTELTNDENGHKVCLTPEQKEINETVSLFYKKRHHIIR